MFGQGCLPPVLPLYHIRMAQLLEADFGKRTKETLAQAAPRLAEDIVTLANQSDDLEAKLKLLDKITKLNGWDPRPDANASLATLNVTIVMGEITADPVTVDVQSVDKAEVEDILLPEPERATAMQPAQAEPALALEILPLDD